MRFFNLLLLLLILFYLPQIQSISCADTCATCVGTATTCTSCNDDWTLVDETCYPPATNLKDLFLEAPLEHGTLTIVKLVKMMQYVKYLDINMPPRLRRMAIGKGRNLLSSSSGALMLSGTQDNFNKFELANSYEKNRLHSSFLVNFWEDFMTILIAFGLALLFIAGEKIAIVMKWGLTEVVCMTLRMLAKWNAVIIVTAIVFDDIILYSAIEFQSYKAGEATGSNMFSLAFSVICICAIAMLTGWIFTYARRLQEKKRRHQLLKPRSGIRISTEVDESVEVIFGGFRDDKLVTQLFFLIYMFRIGLTMLATVILQVVPFFITASQVILSVAILDFLLTKKPFVRKINQQQTVLFESIILIMNIFMFILNIMSMVDAHDTRGAVVLGDFVIIGNDIINILVWVFMGIKLFTEVRIVKEYVNKYKINKIETTGLYLQLLYIPLQMANMGFEEMIVYEIPVLEDLVNKSAKGLLQDAKADRSNVSYVEYNLENHESPPVSDTYRQDQRLIIREKHVKNPNLESPESYSKRVETFGSTLVASPGVDTIKKIDYDYESPSISRPPTVNSSSKLDSPDLRNQFIAEKFAFKQVEVDNPVFLDVNLSRLSRKHAEKAKDIVYYDGNQLANSELVKPIDPVVSSIHSTTNHNHEIHVNHTIIHRLSRGNTPAKDSDSHKSVPQSPPKSSLKSTPESHFLPSDSTFAAGSPTTESINLLNKLEEDNQRRQFLLGTLNFQREEADEGVFSSNSSSMTRLRQSRRNNTLRKELEEIDDRYGERYKDQKNIEAFHQQHDHPYKDQKNSEDNINRYDTAHQTYNENYNSSLNILHKTSNETNPQTNRVIKLQSTISVEDPDQIVNLRRDPSIEKRLAHGNDDDNIYDKQERRDMKRPSKGVLKNSGSKIEHELATLLKQGSLIEDDIEKIMRSIRQESPKVYTKGRGLTVKIEEKKSPQENSDDEKTRILEMEMPTRATFKRSRTLSPGKLHPLGAYKKNILNEIPGQKKYTSRLLRQVTKIEDELDKFEKNMLGESKLSRRDTLKTNEDDYDDRKQRSPTKIALKNSSSPGSLVELDLEEFLRKLRKDSPRPRKDTIRTSGLGTVIIEDNRRDYGDRDEYQMGRRGYEDENGEQGERNERRGRTFNYGYEDDRNQEREDSRDEEGWDRRRRTVLARGVSEDPERRERKQRSRTRVDDNVDLSLLKLGRRHFDPNQKESLNNA